MDEDEFRPLPEPAWAKWLGRLLVGGFYVWTAWSLWSTYKTDPAKAAYAIAAGIALTGGYMLWLKLKAIEGRLALVERLLSRREPRY